MNFKSKLVSVFGAGIIALSMVGGVAANNQVDVNVEVIKGGSGTLTYSLSAGTFSTATTSLTNTATSEGTLTLNVLDERFNFEGWTITMSATEFTSPGKQSFGPEALQVSTDGTVQPVRGDAKGVTASGATMSTQGTPVIKAERGTGSGEYQMVYKGKVTVPANTQAGTYTTTITVNGTSAP